MNVERRSIAFVTCARLPGLSKDDRIAAEALGGRGFDVRAAVWDDAGVDWTAFGAVVFRSCWDYHLHPDRFTDWLGRLDELGCNTWNPTAAVRWNHDKLYLETLSRLGLPVVPTIFLDRGDETDLADLMDRLGCGELVVKPRVGLTAYGAWRASRARAADDAERLRRTLAASDLLVQPMIEEVILRGEWSLIYLDGVLSHAVLKRAQPGDFRVQREWGGTETPGTPPPHLVKLAARTLAAVEESWLYARVDVVDTDRGGFLMELELIEPDLFFRCEPRSADRFCAAVGKRV